MAKDDLLKECNCGMGPYVNGKAKMKVGGVILTRESLTFRDTKYMAGAGLGAAGAAIGGTLQKRHEQSGALYTIALESITRVERQKRALNKNLMLVQGSDGEYLLSDGWKISTDLRQALINEHGRRIVEQGPDVWGVESA